MGNSVAVPGSDPSGSFDHKVSEAHVRVFRKDGQMQHEIRQSGLLARYPAAYAIGFGKIGKSYLVEIGGHLFQSPAAFYTAKDAWAESPGYENDPVLDFWRAMDSSCLSCHTGSIKQVNSQTVLSPISCDRCHGDASRHLANPVPGSIINPSRLAVRQRDSVCEQCHLEGVTTVLNPGKHWGGFQPGQQLDRQQTTYILKNSNGGLAAVSHVEQLALSACKRADPAKLWCGTCHDAHAPAGDHREQINSVCTSCHVTSQLVSTHRNTQANCVSCHMPKLRAADISHAAITDHRILRKPGAAPNAGSGATQVAAWTPPASDLTQRDLGLALFNLAREGKPAGSYPESFRLLSSSTPAALADTDAAVAAAEGYMLLGSGHADSAVAYFRKAVSADRKSAEYWLDLGVAEQAQGSAAAAQNSLEQSIQCNPTDYRPYEALAGILTSEGQKAAADRIIRSFLQANPQSILMRLRHGS